MIPQQINIQDYTYELPEKNIAFYPLADRNQSKQLVFKNGFIQDDYFFNVYKHLAPNSLLVFNESKTINARFHFKTITGALIEIFVLEPANKIDAYTFMQQTQAVECICLVGNLKRFKDAYLELVYNDITLKATLLKKEQEGCIIKLEWNKPLTFADVLDVFGNIPLPPYIKRNAEIKDKETYQTVYSKVKGSVATPTAGLHFTEETLTKLQVENFKFEKIVLHVGAGTFKPVKTDTIGEHTMHAEEVVISVATLKNIISNLGNITVVGTTSCRALESLYWIGIKILNNTWNNNQLEQWECYQLEADYKSITPQQSLTAIVNYLSIHQQSSIVFKTQIVIVPGYSFKIINALITNFHQPASTLLLLIAALIGLQWKIIYEHALKNDYRFLSYGDSCLISAS